MKLSSEMYIVVTPFKLSINLDIFPLKLHWQHNPELPGCCGCISTFCLPRVSLGEGDVSLGKPPLPAMGLLGLPVMIHATPCWAAQVSARDKIRQWKPPLGPTLSQGSPFPPSTWEPPPALPRIPAIPVRGNLTSRHRCITTSRQWGAGGAAYYPRCMCL